MKKKYIYNICLTYCRKLLIVMSTFDITINKFSQILKKASQNSFNIELIQSINVYLY